jgi:tRNA-Thr(GGU) m(6)t(6)A37 methyltransferase TsaA
MLPGFDLPQAFEGLEGFSHLWVIFGFHACRGQWRSRVRPPRLGGNREVGVFASRSPFRPNGLGLSVLRFEGLQNAAGLRLYVSALDLLDGTPVYDIKPYVPYVDSIPDALGGFASDRPVERLEVMFSAQARASLAALPDAAELAELIRQTLALDPRPAYRQADAESRLHGMRLGQFDVRWRVRTGQVVVEEIAPAKA